MTAPKKGKNKPKRANPPAPKQKSPARAKPKPKPLPVRVVTPAHPKHSAFFSALLAQARKQTVARSPSQPQVLHVASHGGDHFVQHAPGSVIPFSGRAAAGAGSDGFKAAAGEANALFADAQKALMTWGECVAHPFSPVKGVLPSSEKDGIVLQDPYTKHMFGYIECGNGAGSGSDGLCIYQFDCWASIVANPDDNYTILQPNGATSYPLFVSRNMTTGAAFPAEGAAVGGVNAGVALGDVDPNITSSAGVNTNTGTEFAQISGGLRIMAQSTTVADGFQGELFRVSTRDPITSPIQGQTLDDLRAAAAVPGSNIFVDRFKITQDGLFAAMDGTISSYVEVVGVPLSRDSWRIHNVSPAGNSVTTMIAGQVGFYVRGVATGGGVDSTYFTVEAVSNYGIERYPSARVVRALPQFPVPYGQLTSMASALAHAVAGIKKPTLSGIPVGQAAGLVSAITDTPGYGKAILDAVKKYGPGLLQGLMEGGGKPALQALWDWVSGAVGFGSPSPPPLVSLPPAQGPWGWVEEIPEAATEAITLGEELLPLIEVAAGAL
jgi:hypothetical protein